MTSRSGWTGALVAVAVGLGTASAFGQDAAALATRRELIEQAQQARNANNHQNALDLAERASRIQMSASLRLFVAQEQNSLGRLAEALGNADQCRRDAESDTTQRNREQVAAACRDLATGLRTRVGRVVIQPPTPAPAGMHVTVSGTALNDALYGIPYVVSPGSVAVEATADGYTAFHRDVEVTAGGSVDVRLDLQRDTSAATQSTTTTGTTGTTTTTTTSSAATTPAPAASSGGVSIPGIALLGVGVVGLGAAAVVFFALRGPAVANYETMVTGTGGICPGSLCQTQADRDRALPLQNSVNLYSGISLAALAVGVVGLGAGVVLMLKGGGGSSEHAPAAAPRSTLLIAPTPGGALLGLQGTF